MTFLNPYLLFIDLAGRLRDDITRWGDENEGYDIEAPMRCRPNYLLNTLKNIEAYCLEMEEKDEPNDMLAICKMHRGIGHVRACMVMLGIATWDQIREHFHEAHKAFPEVPDDELRAHCDPDSWFRLDIGGEG